MKKIDWFIIVVILFVSVFTLKELFKPGMYTSHDGLHQVARFYYFDQSLRDGQIPPRWAQGLMNGFGYPLFIFSYQLPWFFAEFVRVFGASIIESVKLTFLIGFTLSGITMYLCQKNLFGRFAGFAGTALYLFAPYRFSNIFVRASIGDATTFIFAPLIFWSLWKLKEKTDFKWVALGALGVAGLILSHAMVAVLFFSIFGLYFLFSFFSVKNKISYLKSCFFLMLGGLGVSAYYFIPSILERGNTKFQELMGQIFVGNYFANINDLIYSKWAYGVFHSKEGAMSIQLGLAQWLVVAILAVTLIIYLLKRNKSKTDKSNIHLGIFLIFAFAFSVFMMLPQSLPVWKTVSKYVFIDFPWRMLAVSTFLVSICTGMLVSQVKRFRTSLILFLIISAIYFNRNHLRINEILPWDLSFILKLEKTTNSYDEYTPKWVKNEYLAENKPRVEFAGAKEGVEILKNKSNLLEFSLAASQSGQVRVNTIYYPGWKVYVDGKEEKIDYSNGLIEFKVGEGRKNVVARFTETPLRLISNIITLASLGLLILPLLPLFKKLPNNFWEKKKN